MEPGARAVLRDLKSRPELNGQPLHPVAHKKRLESRPFAPVFVAIGSRKGLETPRNNVVLQSTRVRTRTVTLETWLDEKERWTVRLPDLKALKLTEKHEKRYETEMKTGPFKAFLIALYIIFIHFQA